MDKKIKDLRSQIDKIDKDLITLLAKRFLIAKNIGRHKKANNISFFDKKRSKEVLEKALIKAKELSLPEKFIRSLFKLIHNHSLEIQKKDK